MPVALAALALLGATPAEAADAFSTDPVEVAPQSGTQTVVSQVRVGHHAGFDRLVFTFAGPLPGYSVAYVPRVVHDASGASVTLQGSSFVAITLRPTSTEVPAPQGVTSAYLPMLRQVAGAGDFEAVTSYGVGLASRSGLRVLTLSRPNRLVIDFAIPGPSDAPTGATATVGNDPTAPTDGAATGASTTAPARSGSAAPGSAAASAGGTDHGPSAPALAVALGGAGALLLGLAGYHVRRRRRA